ncbi:LbetaH domain-containing protein [Comamonas odontotermitis]|uniref:LpxA family transferase n=2 Tax=Comamonas odontotermitis TaxID=379895 RepID=UPI001CC56FBC|nr:LpxA family transferase [Comamonas odontotermitis]UBB16876.1 LpxA family transferase [Comamonas odontotermitis]
MLAQAIGARQGMSSLKSSMLCLQDYLPRVNSSPIKTWASWLPWELTSQSETIVTKIAMDMATEEFDIAGDIAIHRTAIVESGAVLKGPLVIGARSFIATGAYLRGGCWLDEDCVIGPCCELKSSYVFAASKLAHFNFVGDSIIGERVNIEAGAIICNYRNERPEAGINVRVNGVLSAVNTTKFGALVGDGCRLGANSVVAPGALLKPESIIGRTALCDQEIA